jgi:hypothetical protein
MVSPLSREVPAPSSTLIEISIAAETPSRCVVYFAGAASGPWNSRPH